MVEAFGAIRAAAEQPSDVTVMAGSTMKQRDVLVDREGRRDRRSELNQLHVLLCVVARQHVQLPIRRRRRGAQLTAATASIDRHARNALERLTAPLRAAGDVVAAHRRRDRPLLGRPDPVGVAVYHACSERA